MVSNAPMHHEMLLLVFAPVYQYLTYLGCIQDMTYTCCCVDVLLSKSVVALHKDYQEPVSQTFDIHMFRIMLVT